jgi:CRISPR-associated protein Cas1
MPEVAQNTLYLLTPGTYVSRDHLTVVVETPAYPEGIAPEARLRAAATSIRKLAVPIHHLESICLFGQGAISPPALDLCWEHGVAVNYLTENGYLQARLSGVADTSVALRRAQFRAADDPARARAIARCIVAGKLQNSRNSLLRAARESTDPADAGEIHAAAAVLADQIAALARDAGPQPGPDALDRTRGAEGFGAKAYFSVFSLALKQQRPAFAFTTRSRRPPRDRINCLLSFLYALLRHDCIAALTATGLDPFVGFLHADRPNRPGLALDLMEEFRPWLADRLAITLINRQQVAATDFHLRPGGAVELTDPARRALIKAYQERKQDQLVHPLLDQTFRLGQLPFVQARILARHLRGDIPAYLPFVPK